jgi:hypothetical protein
MYINTINADWALCIYSHILQNGGLIMVIRNNEKK